MIRYIFILLCAVLVACSRKPEPPVAHSVPVMHAKRVYDGMPRDLCLSFGTEWGFAGFIDPDSYQHDLGGPTGELGRKWAPESVLGKAISEMNAGRGFFWGSSEAELRYVLNPTDFDSLRSKAWASFSGTVNLTRGHLCLTTDHSMAAAAQLPEEWTIPMAQDVVWNLSPGSYTVEVLQFFKYDASEQCPGDCDPTFDPKATHYAIRIAATNTPDQKTYDRIPLQATFYRNLKK